MVEMNKSIKIGIGIVIIAVIVAVGCLCIVANRKNGMENKIATNANNQEMKEKAPSRIVMVNGKLYYDTGKESNSSRCGVMDGKITSNIEETKIPTVDNQSNFEGEYGYQYGLENTIEVCINDKWCIFEAKEENSVEQYSFYGVVKEANQSSIIVEPNEGEEIRKSADKISIHLGADSDVLYEVGTNVKITYTGYIMETYPAQVNAVNIELKSAEEFEIRFYDKQPQNNEKIHKVLDKSETNKYDYNIYAYEGSVNIVIDGKEMSLKDALLNNKITMEEIIAKATKDLDEKKISGDMYRDGGSIEYQYENYTIIKCHTIEGNRDVYIGRKGMSMNDVCDCVGI